MTPPGAIILLKNIGERSSTTQSEREALDLAIWALGVAEKIETIAKKGG